MKRLGLCASVLAALLIAMPASGSPTPRTGGVLLPTSASASILPRVLYSSSASTNQIFGDVFKLAADADGTTYTLTLTGGLSGMENLDAYFYTAGGDYPGALCSIHIISESPTRETGTICPKVEEEAAWAIVVLRSGAKAAFDFSYITVS